MKLSYWEKKSWFADIDFCIIGSGIVGISCALHLKKMHPKSKILVLEKGILPQGASTKNAGFACFGSMSEILSDLKHHTKEEVFDLVNQRYKGLKLLRETLGDKNIDYQQNGGYEVFLNQDEKLFETCKSQLEQINQLLKPIFNADVFEMIPDHFHFKNTLKNQIFNQYEGQIDTGKMMQNLLQKVQSKSVMVLNAVEVLEFSTDFDSVKIKLKGFDFSAKQLFIATNAFAKELIDIDIQPTRNQVIITKPIKNLRIKGAFHLREGYFYFRNIDNRILLGGGRHLDPKSEMTKVIAQTEKIQSALENILYHAILPQNQVEIEDRWSGILGIGKQKNPIIKAINDKVFCAVRLGGMGVAIGSETGRKLAMMPQEKG